MVGVKSPALQKAIFDLAIMLRKREGTSDAVPFHIDLRTQHPTMSGVLTKYIIEHAAQCMRGVQLEKGLGVRAVAGIPRKGNAFALSFARLAGEPCALLEKYDYNRVRCVASLRTFVSPAGKELLASEIYKMKESVENVFLVGVFADTGKAACETIEILQEEKLKVSDLLVIVDFERGARERLAQWKCNLHALFTITDLNNLYNRAEMFGLEHRVQPGFSTPHA